MKADLWSRMKAAQEVGRRGGVLVTGGGSGLGEAVARKLRSEGLSVMIADLNPTSSKLASSIGADFSVCDVSSEKNVQETVDRAVASFGSLSATVNCAGIAIAQKVISKKGGNSVNCLFLLMSDTVISASARVLYER